MLDGDNSRVYPSSANGGAYQTWYVRATDLQVNGLRTYTVRSSATGKCLDGDAGRLYVSDCNGGNYQNWMIEPADARGFYTVTSVATGKRLDGNAEQLYPNDASGNDYQKWALRADQPRFEAPPAYPQARIGTAVSTAPPAYNQAPPARNEAPPARAATVWAGWYRYTGSIPSGAVAFQEVPGQTRYVCRGSYKGANHPGKVVGTTCNIGYGGAEVLLDKFEILVDNADNPKFRWEAWRGSIPANAVFGGVECNGGENCNNRLFIGMGTYQGYNQQVGKIMSRTKALNFGYGGAEIANVVPAFILTTPAVRFSSVSTCIDACADN